MPTDVAVIHAGRDREVAARIVSLLRRQGIDVWIDPESLVWGRTPVESVLDAARSAKLILYLCSPATFERHWVQTESSALMAHQFDRSNLRIVPVVVEPCELPPLLDSVDHFDLTSGDFDVRLADLADIVRRVLAKRTVFICHSSRDKKTIGPLVTALRGYPELAIWYDETSLKAGSIIRRGIETGISKADYLVAVLSSSAVDSIEGWIGFELDQAYEKERERNKRGHYFVIPVLIETNVRVPGWLSTKVYVDLEHDFDTGIKRIVEAVYVAPPLE